MTFANLVLRRWWLFMLFVVMGLAGAYLATSRTPPRYQSIVSLQLNPAARSAFLRYDSTNAAVDTGPAAALAASYAEVLKSRTFGDVVVKKLQLSVPPDAIARAIDAKLIPNTNILRLTITWDQPQDAQQLAQSIAEIFIAQNLQQQTNSGPRVQDLEDSARQLQTQLGGLRDQRDRLDQAVARGDLSRLTALNELDTRLSALETSYANLLVEINRARSSQDTAAILDNASAPQMVGVPALWQALMFGVLGSLGLAAGLAWLLDFLADAIRSPEDIVALLDTGPLVAVGHAPMGSREHRRGAGRMLLVNDAPRTATAEAFRTLRTNLRLAAFEHPLHSLVVTSAGPREGKTFIATNLAAALAHAGNRVLLVDADLRRPSVHSVIGIPNEIGLVGALAAAYEHPHSDADDAPPVGIVAGGVPNLWCLPAGGTPPNPSDLLNSATMQRLLARWILEFDIVVVDTPPVGPVADALPLAALADAALLVVRAGRTRRPAIRGALEALRAAGRPVLGLVLNDLRAGPLARFGPYSYYYSNYYASEQNAHPAPGFAPSPHTVHVNGTTPTPTGQVQGSRESGVRRE